MMPLVGPPRVEYRFASPHGLLFAAPLFLALWAALAWAGRLIV